MPADPASLYASDAIVVDVRDGGRVVYAGIRATPGPDEVGVAVRCAVDWLRAHENARAALHIQHVESDRLDAPDLGLLMRLVSELFQHREVIERVVCATCVQAKELDEPAKMARDLFLGLYNPANFKIVVGDERAQSFLARYREPA